MFILLFYLLVFAQVQYMVRPAKNVNAVIVGDALFGEAAKVFDGVAQAVTGAGNQRPDDPVARTGPGPARDESRRGTGHHHRHDPGAEVGRGAEDAGGPVGPLEQAGCFLLHRPDGV